MIVVAILTVRGEAEAAFRAYETKAVEIMGRYGGSLEGTIAVASADGGATFKEIHLIHFPGPEAFAAYRGDATLAAAAPLRAAAILHTEILVGTRGPDYGSDGA
jgi:hypothetical protein